MKENRKCYGRPPGKKKTAKIEIVIEPDLKAEFMELLHSEGKYASVEICTWIRNYIKMTKEGNE
ncbi:antitoxin [Sedimentibacter sp.]|uniref:antitoxin n=1 Tax=Sedimentibacter sp. TaxID=1960295 RepID=UPI0028A7689B|nr:antitoxin [Sedimentibacter sp.]